MQVLLLAAILVLLGVSSLGDDTSRIVVFFLVGFPVSALAIRWAAFTAGSRGVRVVQFGLFTLAVHFLLLLPAFGWIFWIDGNEVPYATAWVRQLFPYFGFLTASLLVLGMVVSATLFFQPYFSGWKRLVLSSVVWVPVLGASIFMSPNVLERSMLLPGLSAYRALEGGERPSPELYRQFLRIQPDMHVSEVEHILGPPPRIVNLEDSTRLYQYLLYDNGGWRLGVELEGVRVRDTYLLYWFD